MKLYCLAGLIMFAAFLAMSNCLVISRSLEEDPAVSNSNDVIDKDIGGPVQTSKRSCGFLDLGGHCDAVEGADRLDQIKHLRRTGGPGR